MRIRRAHLQSVLLARPLHCQFVYYSQENGFTFRFLDLSLSFSADRLPASQHSRSIYRPIITGHCFKESLRVGEEQMLVLLE